MKSVTVYHFTVDVDGVPEVSFSIDALEDYEQATEELMNGNYPWVRLVDRHDKSIYIKRERISMFSVKEVVEEVE